MPQLHSEMLPPSINCPHCGAKMDLDDQERVVKTFDCPACKKVIDLGDGGYSKKSEDANRFSPQLPFKPSTTGSHNQGSHLGNAQNRLNGSNSGVNVSLSGAGSSLKEFFSNKDNIHWSFSHLPSWVYVLGGVTGALCLLITLRHHDRSPSPQASQDQTNGASLDHPQGNSAESGSSQTSAESVTSLSVTSAVIVANGDIFGGTNYGLFSSKDFGSTWEKVPIKTYSGHSLQFGDVVNVYDSGKNNFIAICVAMDPLSMADSLWWLCDGRSYYLARGGNDWLRFFPPSKSFGYHALSSFVSVSNSTIFASSSDEGKSRVWRSNNGGQSWLNAGLAVQGPLSLRVSPQRTLFARATFNDRNLYRSTDEGATWRLLNLLDNISSLAFTGGGNIVAFNGARSHVSSSGEFTSYHYLSSDDGNEWEEVSDNTFTSEWESVVCSDGSILQVGFATIYSSGNNSPSGWLGRKM
jgi:hypothetical protein